MFTFTRKVPKVWTLNRWSNKTAPECPRILNSSFQLAYSKRAHIFESLIYIHKNYLAASH
ncbi:unnamed protein product [Tenebrio molitor]|nr:unnamed protein product [Tenebrio molitor]